MLVAVVEFGDAGLGGVSAGEGGVEVAGEGARAAEVAGVGQGPVAVFDGLVGGAEVGQRNAEMETDEVRFRCRPGFDRERGAGLAFGCSVVAQEVVRLGGYISNMACGIRAVFGSETGR